MAVVENWYPPSKENYDFMLFIWYFFPLVCWPPKPAQALPHVAPLTGTTEQRRTMDHAVVRHGQDVGR